MKREFGVVLALMLCLAFPIGSSAQGWFGGLFGSGGQGGPCAASCAPACPSVLKFDVGYLFGDRNVRNDVSVNSNDFFGRRAIRQEFSLQGVQLGATLQAPLKDDFGVLIRGTWLIPSKAKAAQTNDDITFIAARDWSTKLQYYTLEAAALYPVCAPCSLVAGFRFDSLTTDFKDPVRKIDFSSSRSSDQMEHTYNAYIPYAGIAIQSGQALRVWMIGTPILWGQVKYRETVGSGVDSLGWNANSFNNSYFVECGVDYELHVFGGTAGVLAKWTSLYTKGNATFNDASGGAIIAQDAIGMSVSRQNVLLAAQFSLPFTTPW